ncbi:MAG: dethiobiotin synthase [Candidatus Endonucleobacter bathymodioli]|uniref:ATP-dependent dethiobiotin synthetase BioD n=1 Tax=Candidatus Endonucleibacter bathymodioli TaxID=539814 RepID=A0AA90STB2_9GAMM|nr:dethiobiotin synthase [Candidatus Endonucleobacter bathymodioli]
MNKKIYFVTGTDTDVGKTIVSCGLLEAARLQGYKTIGLKPVSAGCYQTKDGLKNKDALALMDAMTCKLSYEQVNPVSFKPPIAPHIAANLAGTIISIEQLADFCRGTLLNPAEFILIEGAGGWRTPLNNHQMLSDLAKELNTPVVLVVGVKLGCLNHACLTAEAIIRDGLKLAGWVANCIEPEMMCYEDNIKTLRSLIPAPCLGTVPYLSELDKTLVASYFNLEGINSRK